jgi:hypothetical protein
MGAQQLPGNAFRVDSKSAVPPFDTLRTGFDKLRANGVEG